MSPVTANGSAEIELDRAAFIVSIDTEMAWGQNHKPLEPYHYPNERADLARLIELLDHYKIPATFAIVGHLMLDSCEAVEGQKHPEIVRPDYNWFEGDWFDADPCSNTHDAPDFYAPDLLPLIMGATAGHEIASHGFSHVMAGEPGCSREAFDSELRAAVSAAAKHGLKLRSIIHPRNSIGHIDLLAEHGFIAYRGPRAAIRTTRLQQLVDRTVGSDRTAVRPVAEGQIWSLPATTMFSIDSRSKTWRLWIRQVERRLDQAVGNRAMFHCWFHPHNLRDNTEQTFAALERLCRSAAVHRDAGRLDMFTMGGLAETMQAQHGPKTGLAWSEQTTPDGSP